MTEAQRRELARAAAGAVDADGVVARARDLVRVRSVFEPGRPDADETAAAGFVARSLREMGLEPVVEDAAPGRPNVICDWSGTGYVAGRDRTLLFEGHTDVVTEGDPAGWSVDPFGGEIRDGRLYGRGSADMKGGVAAAIGALAALRRAAPYLPGRVRLGIVADEEGMMQGIKAFIRNGWADDVDGAIVCEPEENEICLHQKGALRVAVTVTGVMAHGAMPYAGVNPIPALTTYLEAVRAFEREEQARLGAHEYLGLPWLTPTIVRAPAQGEAQLNVMPASAYAALDVRTVPGQDHREILRRLERIAADVRASAPRLEVALECLEDRPWTETPRGDPLVSALERACGVVGLPVRFGGVPGATDGTFLRAWAGVPIVTIGPGDREIPHQRDEFVRIDELVRSARLYAAAAVWFLTEPRAGGSRVDEGGIMQGSTTVPDTV